MAEVFLYNISPEKLKKIRVALVRLECRGGVRGMPEGGEEAWSHGWRLKVRGRCW